MEKLRYFFNCFYLIGIHSIQDWAATTRHELKEKEAQKG